MINVGISHHFHFFLPLCICCYPSTPSLLFVKFIFFNNWFCSYYIFCCFHWLSSSYICDVVRRQKWWKNQQCCLKIISSFDPLIQAFCIALNVHMLLKTLGCRIQPNFYPNIDHVKVMTHDETCHLQC
jgi:hypothetical protein